MAQCIQDIETLNDDIKNCLKNVKTLTYIINEWMKDIKTLKKIIDEGKKVTQILTPIYQEPREQLEELENNEHMLQQRINILIKRMGKLRVCS